MKKKIFGISGWSGSGKTDLICRLIEFFSKKNITVSTIKHTSHRFSVDKEGKDSFMHSKKGAYEVIIGGKNKWAMFHNGNKDETLSIDELVNKISKNTDLILVEGFKDSKIPKLEVYNSNLGKKALNSKNKTYKAIVYNKLNEQIEKVNKPKFEFNQTEKIARFIIKFLKYEKKID